ncbi:MAG: GGDEF domain-containing protein, partial [Nitrospiria bacterium]
NLVSPLLRGYDIFCRLGGDEFIIVLPNTSKEGVQVIADRLRKAVSQHHFLKRKKVKATISVGGVSRGVSRGVKEVKNAAAIIELADKALYEAKKKGRNCVCIH